MNNHTSIKVSENGITFLKKMRTNRRKLDIDSEDSSYWKLLEIIEKYFKLNNDSYLDLIKIEWSKNV